MSAHFAPLIFLCRMAVYAAALVVLATARLPEPPAYEVAVAPTAPHGARGASGAHRDAPGSDASGIRIALAAILLVGASVEAHRRRSPWR